MVRFALLALVGLVGVAATSVADARARPNGLVAPSIRAAGQAGGSATTSAGTVDGAYTFVANGTTLEGGTVVTSPDGGYTMAVGTDGNVTLTDPQGGVPWQTGTPGNPGATFVVQTDNNLVLYAPGGSVLWSTETQRFGDPATAELVLSDSGELSLAASGTVDGQQLWVARGSLGSTLASGETMLPGNFLAAPGGAYYLTMNYDGAAAVVYWPGPGQVACPMWIAPKPVFGNIGGFGPPTVSEPSVWGSSLTLEDDGDLVLTDPHDGDVLWQSGTAASGADPTLSLQDDGNLVLYADDGTVMWASGTDADLGPALCVDQVMSTSQRLSTYQGWSLQLATVGSAGTGAELDVVAPNGELSSHVWTDSSAPSDVYLIMQADGNLVVYPTGGGDALWSTGTDGNPGAIADISWDGEVQVLARTAAGGDADACATTWTIWTSVSALDCQTMQPGSVPDAAATDED